MVNAEASKETAPALITKPGPSTLSSGGLGGQPEGLPSLPQACDALITSLGEPLAPTQPSLPLVSANPSLTVGRYGLINRGETPCGVWRKKQSLILNRVEPFSRARSRVRCWQKATARSGLSCSFTLVVVHSKATPS